MINAIQILKDNYTYFCQNIFNITIIFLIVVFFLLRKNKSKVENKLVSYIIVTFVIIICPIVAYFVYGNYTTQNGYFVVFYTIPIIIVVAYTFVLLFWEQKNVKYKVLLSVICVGYIVSTVVFSTDRKELKIIHNTLGIEDEIIEICDLLNEQPGSKILAEDYFANRAREYTTGLCFIAEPASVTHSRKFNPGEGYSDMQGALWGLSDSQSYINVAEQYGCNYVVIDISNDDTSLMNSSGYKLLKETENYRVYAANYYSITQYQSASGMQSMIYTIEDRYGHLAIVDGGWSTDAEQLEQIIDAHGGHVDAWFITHPHEDHVSAFNKIFGEDNKEYKVDALYVSDFDYEQYKSEAKEWDGFFAYEDFVNITKSWDNVYELHADDRINVFGLDIHVLHSYSNKVEGTDAANDGSLILKIRGQSQSMLFCGDTGVNMSQTLIDMWGDELKANYIQMGHHGNGGLNADFYEIVQPEVAFFDAPEWLMYPEEGTWYTTTTNIELMESMGAQILWYNTSPNTVLLR